MLTIAQTLELEVFQNAGAEVVSGERLDRSVRWAHIAEVLEIGPFLRGGELVLVSAVLMGRGGAFATFVDDLVEVGASAIVVERPSPSARLPAELVERARRRRLPLIALRRPTRFIEITEQVHSAILDRQYGMLRRADRLAHEFHSLLLDGAELHEVVARLAQVVENAVVLEDAAHQVVEYASYHAPIAWLLQSWSAHSRGAHDDDACVLQPVLVRGELWGRLHVVHVDTPLDDVVRIAVDRAAAAVGLALLSERDSIHRRNLARSELLARIRRQRDLSASDAFAEASALGADLVGRRLVGLALESERGALAPDRLLDELRVAAADLGCTSLSGLEGGRAIALLGTPHDLAPSVAAERVARAMISAHPSAGVRAGVSEEQPTEHVGRALEHAIEAIEHVRAGQSIVHVGDLGLARLLEHLDDDALLARFVERELGALLAANTRRGVDMVGTLRAFLEANGQRAATARALHLGRPAVYKRLARLQSLMHRDLDDARSRAILFAALEGLDVLARRARV